jgi:hypothetical protein
VKKQARVYLEYTICLQNKKSHLIPPYSRYSFLWWILPFMKGGQYPCKHRLVRRLDTMESRECVSIDDASHRVGFLEGIPHCLQRAEAMIPLTPSPVNGAALS